MKIAFICHIFPRLHNTFILNEIIELIKQGHEVEVFSIFPSKEVVFNKDVEVFSLSSRTRYFYEFKGDSDLNVAMFSRYAHLFHGEETAFPALANYLKDREFDVIHGAFGNRPATAAMVLSELSGIPFTFEAHTYDLFVDFPFAKEKLEKALFVTTESKYNRDYLLAQLGAHFAPKIHVVHLAPNIAMMDLLDSQPKKPFLIISSCRLHPIKGLKYALQAVARVKSDFPQLQYVIIGDGVLKEVLKQEVLRLGLNQTVSFAYDVTNEEVCNAVQQASIFLLPCIIDSNGDRDGTPTSIAEAQYLGVPVVASRISGIPELVEDGKTGILTEPEDVGQIVEALKKLLCSPELRLEMGRCGRDKIKNEFNIQQSMNMLVDMWKKNLPSNKNKPVENGVEINNMNGNAMKSIYNISDPAVQNAIGSGMLPGVWGQVLGASVDEPEVEKLLAAIPSETSMAERRFLYNFFRYIWSGAKEVLEIGPFLGGTTRAIALGMMKSPGYMGSQKIHTYDKFNSYYTNEDLRKYIAPLVDSGQISHQVFGELMNANETVEFKRIFDLIHSSHSYYSAIQANIGVLPDYAGQSITEDMRFKVPPGREFDVVFIDGCKSWYGTKYFFLEIAESLSPQSYLIFQDYGWFTCFWIPAFMQALSPFVQLVANVDYTYAFQLTRAISAKDIEQRFPDSPEEAGLARLESLYEGILDNHAAREDYRALVYSRMQLAGACAYLGCPDKAKQIFANLLGESYSKKFHHHIAVACTAPTYSPSGAIELSW